MGLFMTDDERDFATAVAGLVYVNPFLPERIRLEKDALGPLFTPEAAVWSFNPAHDIDRPNVLRIKDRVDMLAVKLRERLAWGVSATAPDLQLYEDLVLYRLYYRIWPAFDDLDAGRKALRPAAWKAFAEEVTFFLRPPNITLPHPDGPAHLLALFFQIRRAFRQIFAHLVGASLPAARLRAAVWESIFTHNLSRYRRGLWSQMNDIPTLIVGPTGTGKELVARAVALSRYIPFDPKTLSFSTDFTATFIPLNLSALSPQLIESELFGHKRGAFTGATSDRPGYLESCPPLGSIFLDEIGELDSALQVKLLRVLQDRSFQRLGDTTPRRFLGKIIAATNRDLAAEIQSKRFRADFYYRLCADVIATPTLRDQLADQPSELEHLVRFIARHITGEKSPNPELAEELTADVLRFIRRKLPHYPWPGNVRELEQCVRNILVRGEYTPVPTPSTNSPNLADPTTPLSADDLITRYAAAVYAHTGSYVETARRLKLDRRTIKAKISKAAKLS